MTAIKITRAERTTGALKVFFTINPHIGAQGGYFEKERSAHFMEDNVDEIMALFAESDLYVKNRKAGREIIKEGLE